MEVDSTVRPQALLELPGVSEEPIAPRWRSSDLSLGLWVPGSSSGPWLTRREEKEENGGEGAASDIAEGYHSFKN
jgi:hypothetical protein